MIKADNDKAQRLNPKSHPKHSFTIHYVNTVHLKEGKKRSE